MSWGSGLAVYLLIWWVTLFAVLPWGVRSQVESGRVVPGTEAGAPAKPMILKKFIATSVVSALIFAIFYLLYTSGLVL